MKRGISITGGQLLRRNDDDTDAPNYTARLSTMPPHRHQLLSVCIVHGEPAAAGRDRRLAREAGWLPASAHDWLDDVLAFEVVDARQLAGVANLRAQIAWQKKPAAQERALR
jgi:hypothetical protein